LAAEKLKLVKNGNHRQRITDKITDLGASYDDTVAAVAPDAPAYRDAADIVLRRLSHLLP
jgi:hypothetical protein